jgi:iron complex transport system substrate-binding protein
MRERRSISQGRRPVRTVLLLMAVLVGLAAPAAAREVTDSAGRKVVLPDRIERVFAASPPAAVLVYVLAPEKLLGWPRALTPAERAYVVPAVRDLPKLGRLTGRGDTADLEVVLKARPDVIVDFGTTDGTYVSLADRVQAQTGIPYLLIDGRLASTAPALRLAGEALGVEKRAAALASYAETILAEVDAVLAALPSDQHPRVYLARGADGLETGLRGSISTEIVERAGGVNVAEAGGDRQGIARVQLEQVLLWDPEIIVTGDEGFFRAVQEDPAWAGVRAVREHRVHLSPVLPFGWIDRPPSLNRVIGLKWLTSVFYPHRVRHDMRSESRQFYDFFYGVELDGPALDRLLGPSTGKAP